MAVNKKETEVEMVLTVNLNEPQAQMLARIMEARAIKTKSGAIVQAIVDEHVFFIWKRLHIY